MIITDTDCKYHSGLYADIVRLKVRIPDIFKNQGNVDENVPYEISYGTLHEIN